MTLTLRDKKVNALTTVEFYLELYAQLGWNINGTIILINGMQLSNISSAINKK